MLILSVCIYLVIANNNELSVSALSAGGSDDVSSVWLVLWQLCISRRPGRLFQYQQLIETRRLLEHAPQNCGVYLRPGVYLGPDV